LTVVPPSVFGLRRPFLGVFAAKHEDRVADVELGVRDFAAAAGDLDGQFRLESLC
jgi:hypothetical protein